ncbi:MAG: hypothetical protein KC591_10945 [Gemmatimonadetes bacterium]|nr:hypothetical protein [Gemmatimonadota bacterium]
MTSTLRFALPAGVLFVLGGPRGVGALEGRYLGTTSYTEAGGEYQSVLHRLDVGTRQSVAERVRWNAFAQLSYSLRPGESDTRLMRSRYFGEFEAPSLKIRGQFAPWQDRAAAANPPREREYEFGGVWRSPVGPVLSLDFDRRDEESVFGRGTSEDRRVALRHGVGPIEYGGSWRRLDSRASFSGVEGRTNEWRGGLRATKSWRPLQLEGNYDVLRSEATSRDRVRDLETHRFGLSGAGRITSKVRWSSDGQWRTGRSEDNAQSFARDIDERSARGQLEYAPLRSLDLRLIREHRSSSGNVTADYLRFRSLFRRDVFRQVNLQAGFERTLETFSRGNAPGDVIYTALDGRLRRGVRARGEVRTTSYASGPRRWKGLVQSILDPRPDTHFEVTWQKDWIPPVGTLGARRDREWTFLAGYQPRSAFGVNGSLRVLRGTGRLERHERFGSATVTVRTGERTRLGVDWSERRSEFGFLNTVSRSLGLSANTWLPREFRLVGSAYRTRATNAVTTSTVTVTVDKTFR